MGLDRQPLACRKELYGVRVGSESIVGFNGARAFEWRIVSWGAYRSIAPPCSDVGAPRSPGMSEPNRSQPPLVVALDGAAAYNAHPI